MSRMSADDFRRLHGPKYEPRGLAQVEARKLIIHPTGEATFPQSLWIPRRVPSENEIVRVHWAKVKRLRDVWNSLVSVHATAQRVRPMTRCTIGMEITEPNRRRDPTNVIGGAWKIILDALQVVGLIPNDNAATIKVAMPTIVYDRTKPGVKLMFGEYEE